MYDNTRKNATGARLAANGFDLGGGVTGGVPFLVPTTGAEAMWNCKMHWVGEGRIERYSTVFSSSGDGKFVPLVQDQWTAAPLGHRAGKPVGDNEGQEWLVLDLAAAGARLVAVGERGHVLRSADRGPVADMKWAAIKTPYARSPWTGTALGGDVLLAGGMCGNLVRSTDDGRSWTHQAVAGAGSFTALAPLADGRAVLVGVDGTLVLADAAAQAFRLRRQDDRAP